MIPINHLISFCDYFNVSIDYLFGFTNKKSYEKETKHIDKKLAGLRLKEFRKENNLTQIKLSSILNTSFSVISGYEKGKNIIATPFLYTICSKYHLSADYLLGKINEPQELS